MNAARLIRYFSKAIYFMFIAAIAYFIFINAKSGVAVATQKQSSEFFESKKYVIAVRSDEDKRQYVKGKYYILAHTSGDFGCVLGEFAFVFERNGRLFFKRENTKFESKLFDYTKLSGDETEVDVFQDFMSLPNGFDDCKTWMLVTNRGGDHAVR